MQNNTRLLILCNKQDQTMAKGCGVVQSLLEKEINLLRLTKTNQLEATDATSVNSFIGKPGKDFEFSHLNTRVDFAESGASDIEQLETWLQKVLWSDLRDSVGRHWVVFSFFFHRVRDLCLLNKRRHIFDNIDWQSCANSPMNCTLLLLISRCIQTSTMLIVYMVDIFGTDIQTVTTSCVCVQLGVYLEWGKNRSLTKQQREPSTDSSSDQIKYQNRTRAWQYNRLYVSLSLQR